MILETSAPAADGQGSERTPRRYPLGRWGLAIALGALFLVSWAGQLVFEVILVRNEAHAHDQPFRWAEFWPQFWQSTLENWQSEFLQLLTFVVLTTYLIFRDSHESRDTDDRVEALLHEIDTRLERLERGLDERP